MHHPDHPDHRAPPDQRTFLSTAIPYVNARPHLGFAMELVLADVLARYWRQRGRDLCFVTGSDENSLKNVQAARREGVPTATLVERNAASFRSLRETLGLSTDQFLRTSVDPRHRPGVEWLWRACAARGDIYKRPYRGRYCVGCEQFYSDAELHDGRCPEHDIALELIEESNWFFRLSRYEDALRQRLERGELRIVPDSYRNEILAFARDGLSDFSISRSSERAHGWGIPVPGDPEQVIYVWFDALANYLTALGFPDGPDVDRYWRDSEERWHLLGKGITRFHALYWPAMLLSAGLPLPTTIAVHGYLTVDGRKIGKSLGNAIDPEAIVARHGLDVLRYYLCRHIRTGRDGDFSEARLVQARDAELANQLGNLLKRSVNMVERYCDGKIPARGSTPAAQQLAAAVERAVDAAFVEFRVDEALTAAWSLIEFANKHAVDQAPWRLAKRRDEPGVEHQLRITLYTLCECLRLAAHYLAPFMPSTAARIEAQLGLAAGDAPATGEVRSWGGLVPGTAVRPGPPLFPKRGGALHPPAS